MNPLIPSSRGLNNSTTLLRHEGLRGVMVTLIRNGHSNTCSNLVKAGCISHSADTFRKDMNPTLLPPAMN